MDNTRQPLLRLLLTEQDLVHGLSTSTAEENIDDDEDDIPMTDSMIINKEKEKQLIDPLALLNQLTPGIEYVHDVMKKPPSTIRVKATIHRIPFVARAQTIKAAKIKISIMALYYFYGYNHMLGVTEGWSSPGSL
ncbi:PREDICTED: uncharacterized protein LOC107167779 [Diuraphis noxia]|uniref:uncharacterized protein LOC107167779 n=1 Tax=Diuraphis noxia TaxID=143948 RepID=UPI0007635900|nr:PREDICTED: uncharacterized protein LOC107167779 [Diuraphis noxia]